MARISTYIKDTGLTDKDLLVGSNYVSGARELKYMKLLISH